MRVNVGCGQTPTPGWINFDNSLSVRLAKAPGLWWILGKLNALDPAQKQFIQFARTTQVRYADATRKIPLPDHSAEALYACHMLEHLDRYEALQFLAQARRVLRHNGVLRIAVPDIRRLVEQYLATGDADAFIEATHLTVNKAHTALQRLRCLIVGPRHHHWMYDGKSLCDLLSRTGFADSRVMPAGMTRIENPGDLELAERSSESVYVEALNP